MQRPCKGNGNAEGFDEYVRPMMNGDYLDSYGKLLSAEELQLLEEKIRRKAERFFGTGEGDYIPASGQKNAIIKDLWEYTTGSYYYSKYNPEDYALEIVETCEAVFGAYSVEKGDFLFYFNTAISNTFKSLSGKRQYEATHQTTGLSRRKIAAMGKAVRRLAENNIEPTAEMIIEMAQDEGVNVDYYDAMSYRQTDIKLDKPLSDHTDNKTEYLEVINNNSPEPGLEFIDAGTLEELLSTIDVVFQQTRQGQQGYLSETLTSQFSEAIDGMLKKHEELITVLNRTSWFSPEVFEVFEATGKRKEQKEIAEQYGVTTVTISRAFGRFREKLREIITG